MALVALMTQGPKYLKHLISQNCDGLHRRSGIPVHQLSELHGNTTLEVCNKCSRGYIRDFPVSAKVVPLYRQKSRHDKRTGRMCTVPRCGGALCSSIVNFGESLPERTWEAAAKNADECDVMLSLGSSLTVAPASCLCEQVGIAWAKHSLSGSYKAAAATDASEEEQSSTSMSEPRHHLVIVNLQKTPMDDLCSLRIFAKIDDVMVGLMRELALPIPEWRLQRLLKVDVARIKGRDDVKALTVSAIDVDGITATVFKQPTLRNYGRPMFRPTKGGAKVPRLRDPDVFVFHIPRDLDADDAEAKSTETTEVGTDDDSGLMLDLGFYGHYGEPRLPIRLTECVNGLAEEGGEAVFRLTMDVASKQWTVQSIQFEPLPVVKDIYSFTIKDKKAKKDEKKKPIGRFSDEDTLVRIGAMVRHAVEEEEEEKKQRAPSAVIVDDAVLSVDDTLARIAAMEANFASMKRDFVETIDELGKQIIQKARREGLSECV